MNNILFIDASAFFYRIAHYCDRYENFNTNLIELNFHFLNEARFLLLSAEDRNKVIWCLDCDERDYWRKFYAPNYKAQRRRAMDDNNYQTVKDCFTKLKSQFSYLAYPTFEADDLAALGVELFNATAPLDYHCYLVSPDSDWQGLVNDRVTFLTPTFMPYIRTKKEVYQYLCKAWTKQSKIKQKLWNIPSYSNFKSSDIWVWKSVVGDRSDNLPPGTNIGLIDLFNPINKISEVYINKAYEQISKATFYPTDTHKTMNYVSELLNPPMTIIKQDKFI